jgi:hypothetical protein
MAFLVEISYLGRFELLDFKWMAESLVDKHTGILCRDP